LRGQKFVPSTMMLKVMSMSSWFCDMRSLKESVMSLLRLMSVQRISEFGMADKSRERTSEHALKLVSVLETAGLLQFRDHTGFAFI
jgi:hypothetical protein